MTPPDLSGKNRSTGEQDAALTDVDRLFGRDLRSRGWVLKLAPVIEPTVARVTETENVPDAAPDPAMIWALKWRQK